MKLYNPTPVKVVRLLIKQQGKEPQYLTLCECTKEEARDTVKAWINLQGLGPFQQGRAINIQFREGEGGANGKAISLTFKGMTPREVKELIEKKLKNI